MSLALELYLEQEKRWPQSGRHILAQHDDRSVVVYQAYRPAIGDHAATHQVFGGEFSLNRMSWIKPNFLWMMFRSGWATKPGQEVVLAVTIARDFFEEILAAAVHSSFAPSVYETREAWQARLKASDVRLQWDPDHHPRGGKLERRAIQLGLRGEALRRYATECVIAIEDISELVAEQRVHLEGDLSSLQTPAETVLIPRLPDVRRRLGVDNSGRAQPTPL